MRIALLGCWHGGLLTQVGFKYRWTGLTGLKKTGLTILINFGYIVPTHDTTWLSRPTLPYVWLKYVYNKSFYVVFNLVRRPASKVLPYNAQRVNKHIYIYYCHRSCAPNILSILFTRNMQSPYLENLTFLWFTSNSSQTYHHPITYNF